MKKYYISIWFDRISDNIEESIVRFTASLYRDMKSNILYKKTFEIPFNKNKKITVSGDIELPVNDDESAKLLLELTDGSDLIYA